MTQAARMCLGQLLTSVVILACVKLWVPSWFTSMLIGIFTMMIAFLGVWMVMWYFERYPPRHAKTFLMCYYLAQVFKYVVVVSLVVLYLTKLQMVWLAFLIGICVVQLGALFGRPNTKPSTPEWLG